MDPTPFGPYFAVGIKSELNKAPLGASMPVPTCHMPSTQLPTDGAGSMVASTNM
jgi:hypothetical protein